LIRLVYTTNPPYSFSCCGYTGNCVILTVSVYCTTDRIRIRMFLGLPDPSVFCPDPDPFFNQPKSKKNLDLIFCDLLLTFYLGKVKNWCKCTFENNTGTQKTCQPLMKKAGSGPKCQCNGSADPDPKVTGMDPRIRIHIKMSWIHNTAVDTRHTPGHSKTRFHTNSYFCPVQFSVISSSSSNNFLSLKGWTLSYRPQTPPKYYPPPPPPPKMGAQCDKNQG
jgi:hypothetical protein